MLDELDVFENRVRERAFRMWQEAGCPEDAAEEFWHRARALEMDDLNVTDRDLERVGEKDSATARAADFA